MRRRDRIPASCHGRAGFCRGTTGRAPSGSQAPDIAGLRGACLRSPAPRAGEALHRLLGRADCRAIILSDPNDRAITGGVGIEATYSRIAGIIVVAVPRII